MSIAPTTFAGRRVTPAILALQQVDQRRGDVGAGVPLLHQAPEHLVVRLELLLLERGAEPLEEHVAARLLDLVDRGDVLPADLQLRP
jgi:hypothetical protein